MEQTEFELKTHDEDLINHDHILDQWSINLRQISHEYLISLRDKESNRIESQVSDIKSSYESELELLKAKVNELAVEKENHIGNYLILETKCHQLVEQSIRKSNLYRSRYWNEFSINKIFHAWVRITTKGKLTSKVERLVEDFQKKKVLQKTLTTMIKNFHQRKFIKIQKDSQLKLESITTQIISNYEAELLKLKSDLREAYASADFERVRRQQLEEDLRRMFLKNMTTMNREALTLFQQSQQVHFHPTAAANLDQKYETESDSIQPRVLKPEPTKFNDARSDRIIDREYHRNSK